MEQKKPNLTNKGPSIHFNGMGLHLGGNTILHQINFRIEPATVHCIIGPNGGGKTSLIRSLLGQMPHTGSIDMTWASSEQTAVSYVPQLLDFDRTLPMTVGDFMAMICQRRPVFFGKSESKQEIIMEALQKVNMQEKINYLFGGLSGGERQRVVLAQALIPSPDLLILDEPASGLDKIGSEIMRRLIDQLKGQGTTILMIHHDLGEVYEIADTVTCINQKVLFSGPPQKVLHPDNIFNIYSSIKEH